MWSRTIERPVTTMIGSTNFFVCQMSHFAFLQPQNIDNTVRCAHGEGRRRMRMRQAWTNIGAARILLVASMSLCFTACNQNGQKAATTTAPVAAAVQPLSQCDV